MATLRRGWYLGGPTFADRLRALVSPEQAQGNGREPVATSHHEAEAENLVKRAFRLWHMPSAAVSLKELRKGDPWQLPEAAFIGAMHEAYADGREPAAKDILEAITATVPLAQLMDGQISALRHWAKGRARAAANGTQAPAKGNTRHISALN